MAEKYSFDGYRELQSMGVSWFVSYCYFKNIDSSHNNWKRTDTAQMRIGFYNRSSTYYKDWLLRILQTSETRLNRNAIGLSGKQVKEMAKELLNVLK